MSHLPRLLTLLNTAARYGLDQVSPQVQPSGVVGALFKLWSLPWRLHPSRRLAPEVRLRMALEELGPIYIKFGQLLSTRRDFLPLELADELQSLQDNVPGFSDPPIQFLVEQALARPWQEVFSELNTEALASASVAQVHAARLLTGEEVVVKVIRPGIEKTIVEDIKLLKWIAGLVEEHIPEGRRLRPREVVSDYEKIILDELNLLSEGANATQLRRNFEHSPQLYVPRVYWEYSRSNLLVMERIYGTPVADINSLRAQGVNLKKLAETGVEIFFTQVFNHSFFHADMHPGNIFVAKHSPENPQYIAIDCAIIGSLSKSDQQYLARNLLAIFQRDYRKVAQLHVECGWVPKDTRVHEFEAAMRSVCEPVFEKPLKDISFGYLLVQLFRTAGRFNMEVQPSLVLLQKTLLNVEGLGRQLYPELDLWTTALPFLEDWNRRRMRPSTLFNALKENVPDWIEQLPYLPQLMIDSLTQSKQLTAINETLQQRLLEEQIQHHKRRRRSIQGGLALLAVAIIAFLPGGESLASELSLSGLLLGAAAVYLLCFNR
ncbi:MAG: ubiquinone biosynthesis regulatory protein kinase UbiB [Gammaproteobacteria bacterium]|nr:ubiquinone biosynthesis regulatory protein kinase UbiB [Gammaproteobacteria bacterium]MDP2139904.1 ubiquinone biosynthesis regulatory protein kinase UbiB [Gammaproteobacteria bacterium]MDP2347724.1 ubiquinone biosynthesis regulatory protein kinase UbiB [Gammaproteobacteria bacterium]